MKQETHKAKKYTPPNMNILTKQKENGKSEKGKVQCEAPRYNLN